MSRKPQQTEQIHRNGPGRIGQLGQAMVKASQGTEMEQRINRRQGRRNSPGRDHALNELRGLMADGYDHINLHHRAKTPLGRRLCVDNSDRVTVGQYGSFDSVYNLYAWLTTVGHHASLRTMGPAALRDFLKNRPPEMVFDHPYGRFICKEVLLQKLKADLDLAESLRATGDHPIVSYMVRAEDEYRVPLTKTNWWTDIVREVRAELQGGRVSPVFKHDMDSMSDSEVRSLEEALVPLNMSPVLGNVARTKDVLTSEIMITTRDVTAGDVMDVFDIAKSSDIISVLRQLGIRRLQTEAKMGEWELMLVHDRDTDVSGWLRAFKDLIDGASAGYFTHVDPANGQDFSPQADGHDGDTDLSGFDVVQSVGEGVTEFAQQILEGAAMPEAEVEKAITPTRENTELLRELQETVRENSKHATNAFVETLLDQANPDGKLHHQSSDTILENAQASTATVEAAAAVAEAAVGQATHDDEQDGPSLEAVETAVFAIRGDISGEDMLDAMGGEQALIDAGVRHVAHADVEEGATHQNIEVTFLKGARDAVVAVIAPAMVVGTAEAQPA